MVHTGGQYFCSHRGQILSNWFETGVHTLELFITGSYFQKTTGSILSNWLQGSIHNWVRKHGVQYFQLVQTGVNLFPPPTTHKVQNWFNTGVKYFKLVHTIQNWFNNRGQYFINWFTGSNGSHRGVFQTVHTGVNYRGSRLSKLVTRGQTPQGFELVHTILFSGQGQYFQTGSQNWFTQGSILSNWFIQGSILSNWFTQGSILSNWFTQESILSNWFTQGSILSNWFTRVNTF